MGEFELIRQFFCYPTQHTELGVGDDAALMTVKPHHTLVASTDLLVAQRHFFEDVDPYFLGRKAIAVNVSDLAAMGATPRWVLLGLTLSPKHRVSSWISSFAAGFAEEASCYGLDWVGGDTTSGLLTVISVTVLGEVPVGQAIRRSGALAGDDVWVSESLGGAAAGLSHLKGDCVLSTDEQQVCLRALHHPQARVSLGQALRGLAHAMIDISDGFLADLRHLCQASGLGVDVYLNQIPPICTFENHDARVVRRWVLNGGEDYELCFTASPESAPAIQLVGRRLGVNLTRVGCMVSGSGYHLWDQFEGSVLAHPWEGYDHMD
jgi:thiamine-monophosphate kinase